MFSAATLRRAFRLLNHFMILNWRLGLGRYGNGTRWGGAIMVIRHRGRKSGREYLTPVNYAVVDGQVYCLAGFGRVADWYRNLRAEPACELWLPDGRWAAVAEEATDDSNAVFLLRQVLIGSGFAAVLAGVDPRRLSDEELAGYLGPYRLLRVRRTAALTGPGGPGDLAWIWPAATFLLLLRCRAWRRRALDLH